MQSTNLIDDLRTSETSQMSLVEKTNAMNKSNTGKCCATRRREYTKTYNDVRHQSIIQSGGLTSDDVDCNVLEQRLPPFTRWFLKPQMITHLPHMIYPPISLRLPLRIRSYPTSQHPLQSRTPANSPTNQGNPNAPSLNAASVFAPNIFFTSSLFVFSSTFSASSSLPTTVSTIA
jgi:hypothetical protein